MPRPKKRRRICGEPSCNRFGPMTRYTQNLPRIFMTVDEYEAIRLIDLEGLSQEECAVRMNVARTTAQAIYNEARKKLAMCVVQGNELQIEGGDYEVCDGTAVCEGCARCGYQKNKIILSKKKENIMRIAVTYENEEIFQHFGQSKEFKVYDVDNGKVVESKVVGTDGRGHGALAEVLEENSIDVLICGGIGAGAQEAMANAGIKLYGGVTGSADAAVEALLNDTLDYNPAVQCNHHGHGEHHEGGCGSHGCGKH